LSLAENRWRTFETPADVRRAVVATKAKLEPEAAQRRPLALKAVA
jgi:hypothetical protein